MAFVVPTGAQHAVAVDEMFFSTTDRRGVIDSSNDVFVRLSRYSRNELIGSPHNIIRHPDMPGGAFSAMWQTLESGNPFAAYVQNLAADGSRYDVFATITPLPSGGYLSVRTSPVCRSHHQAALEIYRRTAAEEERLRARGMTRRQAASAGALHITGQLANLGFEDYSSFARTVLPAEVIQREFLGGGLPQRPGSFGPMRIALDAALQLHKGLGAWMSEQEALSRVTLALQNATSGIRRDFAALDEASQAISSAAPGSSARGVLAPLELWSQMQVLVGNQVGRLVNELEVLSAQTAEAKFRIALARLQSTMLASFVAELADGGPVEGDAGDAAAAIRALGEAVRSGISAMADNVAKHRQSSKRVVDLIERTASLTEIPRQLLVEWTAAASTLPPELLGIGSRVSESITHSNDALSSLQRLAEQCRAVTTGHDAALLHESLDEVERAIGV